jgi:hypothetical protein
MPQCTPTQHNKKEKKDVERRGKQVLKAAGQILKQLHAKHVCHAL